MTRLPSELATELKEHVGNIHKMLKKHVQNLTVEVPKAVFVDIWWNYFLHALQQNKFSVKGATQIYHAFEEFLERYYIKHEPKTSPLGEAGAFFSLVTGWYYVHDKTSGPSTPVYEAPTGFVLDTLSKLDDRPDFEALTEVLETIVQIMREGHIEYVGTHENNRASIAIWADYYLSRFLYGLCKLQLDKSARQLITEGLLNDLKTALEISDKEDYSSVKFTLTVFGLCVFLDDLFNYINELGLLSDGTPPTRH